jgi:hypothetical protein
MCMRRIYHYRLIGNAKKYANKLIRKRVVRSDSIDYLYHMA